MGFYPTKKHYIVSHPQKIIYCVIPKVACTTLKQALASALEIKNTAPTSIKENYSPHHAQFTYLLREEAASSKYFDYFKFAFVRNPWDRLVSFFEDKIKATPEEYTKNGIYRELTSFNFNKGMSFSDFIYKLEKIPVRNDNNHFARQTDFVKHQGELIPTFIGYFENLKQDWDKVCKRLGISQNLKHLMKTNRKTYKDYYVDETKEIVSKRYEEEIDLFGYKF